MGGGGDPPSRGGHILGNLWKIKSTDLCATSPLFFGENAPAAIKAPKSLLIYTMEICAQICAGPFPILC